MRAHKLPLRQRKFLRLRDVNALLGTLKSLHGVFAVAPVRALFAPLKKAFQACFLLGGRWVVPKLGARVRVLV